MADVLTMPKVPDGGARDGAQIREAPGRGCASDARAILPGDGGSRVPTRDNDLHRLAASLTDQARDACHARARMRAEAQERDLSDPCICGEALLLEAAAEQAAGRAPVSAFARFGAVA